MTTRADIERAIVELTPPCTLARVDWQPAVPDDTITVAGFTPRAIMRDGRSLDMSGRLAGRVSFARRLEPVRPSDWFACGDDGEVEGLTDARVRVVWGGEVVSDEKFYGENVR